MAIDRSLFYLIVNKRGAFSFKCFSPLLFYHTKKWIYLHLQILCNIFTITTATNKQIHKQSPSKTTTSSIACAEPYLSHKHGILSGSPEGSKVSLVSSVPSFFLPNPHGFAICPENYPSSRYFSPELIRLVTDMHCCFLELQRNYWE